MNTFIRKISVIAIIGLVLITITSCIGTDSAITINNDGSGTIRLSYTISKLIAHLGKLEETDTTVPLPVNREDFERTVERIPGIGFDNYKETEDEENIFITTDLSFSSIQSLNEFLKGSGEDVVSLVQDGADSVLILTVFPGREEGLPESSVEVLTDIFKDYSLNFTINVPDSIQVLNRGTQSNDGKTASLQIPISSLLSGNEPVVWEMTW